MANIPPAHIPPPPVTFTIPAADFAVLLDALDDAQDYREGDPECVACIDADDLFCEDHWEDENRRLAYGRVERLLKKED